MWSAQYKQFIGCLFGWASGVPATAVRAPSKEMRCFDSERRQPTLDVAMPSPTQAKPEPHHQLADGQTFSRRLLQHLDCVLRTPRHGFIVADTLARRLACLPFLHFP